MLAYFILPTQKFIDGSHIALIAKEGERGYYRTDIMLPKEENDARNLVRTLNERLGLTASRADEIVLATM